MFVRWQFVIANVNKENAATTKEIVEELVDRKNTRTMLPHVFVFSREHVMRVLRNGCPGLCFFWL